MSAPPVRCSTDCNSQELGVHQWMRDKENVGYICTHSAMFFSHKVGENLALCDNMDLESSVLNEVSQIEKNK